MHGIEALSTLPRGRGPLGVYETPEQRVPIRGLRVAADVPATVRVDLEVRPAGRVELRNVPIPVRPITPRRD